MDICRTTAMLRTICLLLALAGLASCVGMHAPGMSMGSTSGSAPPDESSAYTTLFVGPGKLQRFIRPVYYKQGRESFELDITYRDSASVPYIAEMRGTLLSAGRIPPDTLAIPNGQGSLSRYPVTKVLYQEGKGNKTATRLEIRLDPVRLQELIRSPAPPILLHRPGAGYATFIPAAKTRKRISKAARLFTSGTPMQTGR